MVKQIYNILTSKIQTSEHWIETGKVVDYLSSNNVPNQFLLLLKPEAINISSNSDVLGILDLIFSTMGKFHVYTNRIRILKGDFILKNDLLKIQYNTLNLLSHLGYSISSDSIRCKINNYISKLPHIPSILGGHEFLKAYNDFSPFSLSVLSDNLGTVKLGAGIYITNVEVTGKSIIILNPFHPFQAKWFTQDSSMVIAIECFSYKSWPFLRKHFAGFIEPSKALKHSLRKKLFEKRKELRISSISKCFNFIHISPGPIEAALQIERYFLDASTDRNNFHQTILEKILLKQGFERDFLEKLWKNPEVLYNSSTKHLFEHTEDMDISTAINLITKIKNFSL